MLPRILCLTVLLLEIRGLYLSLPGRKWLALAFYTQLSNLITAGSALLLVLLGQPAWVTALCYLSACMLVMTFFVTNCVLIPMGGDPKKLLWSGNGLYHHVLCPVVSTLSYIFAEAHAEPRLIMQRNLCSTGISSFSVRLHEVRESCASSQVILAFTANPCAVSNEQGKDPKLRHIAEGQSGSISLIYSSIDSCGSIQLSCFAS